MSRFLDRIGTSLNLVFWCAVWSVAAVLYMVCVCFLGIIAEWTDDRAQGS
jgi:hypothetical protein